MAKLEYLGIDTSNYTTSAALYDGNEAVSKKKLLPVKEGEKGLRQSDALFHHTRQLPDLLDEFPLADNVKAIGVSVRPRNADGSYMPCFLAGESAARYIAHSCGIPLYRSSHQVGHILAALYSCKKLDYALSDRPFIAFHVSGGTTDCLLVRHDPDQVIVCEEISSSLDLKAGQAVDRIGIELGLAFPCGAELEKLALQSAAEYKIKPAIRDGRPSLSGLENICKKMISNGEKSCDVALYCIKYIESAIIAMTEYAFGVCGELPLVYAGGVMADSIIRQSVQKRFYADFAEPSLSSDNACGMAVFAAIKDGAIR